MYIQNHGKKKEGERKKGRKKKEERRRRRRRRRRCVIQKILRGYIIMCKTKDLYNAYFFLTYTQRPSLYTCITTHQKNVVVKQAEKNSIS